MLSRQFAIPMIVATGMLAAGVLGFVSPGCGPEPPSMDKAATYTASSLAQELIFRYQALAPGLKQIRSGSRKTRFKTIVELESEEKLQTKNKTAATTKNREGPATLDDILDDVETKLKLIKGSSRAQTLNTMIEVISKDSSLSDSDKTLLSDELHKLDGGS